MKVLDRDELAWIRYRLDRLCEARLLGPLSPDEQKERDQLGRREAELLAHRSSRGAEAAGWLSLHPATRSQWRPRRNPGH